MADTLIQSVLSFQATPVETGGGSSVVTVISGSTVYYSDHQVVTAGSNQGSIAVGGNQTFTQNVYLIAASGIATVKVVTTPAASEAPGSVEAETARATAAESALSSSVSSAQAASLQKSSNLSDVANAGTARTNLNVDVAGTAASQASAAQAAAIAASLQKSSNLSDVGSASTSRTNLGLGTAATQATGTFAQVANNLSDVTQRTARDNLNAGPRGLVLRPEAYGAVGDVTVFTDAAVTAGSTTITSGQFSSSWAGSKKIYIAWAGAGTSLGTLSAASGTSPTTTLQRTSGAVFTTPIPIIVTSGAHSQVFTAKSGVLNGNITLETQTPTFNFPIGSTISYGNVGLSTTVTYASSNTGTLGAAATTSVSGMIGWFGTDDTTAFKNWMSDLSTFGGTGLLDNKFYLLDGAPDTTHSGNAIVPIIPGNIGATIEIAGSAGFMPGEINSQTNAAVGGSVFFTTRQGDTYDGSHGPPSMIGGGTDEGVGSAGWPVTGTLKIHGVHFVQPENPSLICLDAKRCANLETSGGGLRFRTAGFMQTYSGFNPTTSAYPYIGQVPSNNTGIAFRAPGYTNAGTVILDNVTAFGYLGWGVIAEHAEIRGNSYAQFCKSGICFDTSTTNGGHLNYVTKFGCFDTNYLLSGWSASSGIITMPSGSRAYVFGIINIEEGVDQWAPNNPAILDTNNVIYGRLLLHTMGLLGPDTGNTYGFYTNATKLKVENVDPAVTNSNVQVFTSSGTWTKPAGAQRVSVSCIGGGAGGQSGSIASSGNVAVGGSGGGGGGYSSQTFQATELSATVTVTIGAGTAGGATVTTGSGGWNGFGNGGTTTFGSYLQGGGGTGAIAGGLGDALGGGTSAASGTGGAGGNASAVARVAGGGAGGGVTTGNAASNGGNGGAGQAASSGVSGGAGAGAAGTSASDLNLATGGNGGAGGAGNAAGNGFVGGAGGLYGGGGGGGGGARTGSNSGVGGAGASGICVVISW